MEHKTKTMKNIIEPKETWQNYMTSHFEPKPLNISFLLLQTKKGPRYCLEPVHREDEVYHCDFYAGRQLPHPINIPEEAPFHLTLSHTFFVSP